METTKVFDLKDYPIGNLELHGNTLLIVQEIEVSSYALNALCNMNPSKPETQNNSFIRDFYERLENTPRICVGVSYDVEQLLTERSKTLIGKDIVFSNYDTPRSIKVKDDFKDLQVQVGNFKYDSRASDLTKQSTKYTIRLYSIYSYQFVLAAI